MQPRILVPYDFSPTSDAALRTAVDLHKSLGGPIKLLHLISTPLMAVSVAGEVPLPPPTERDFSQAEGELRQVAASSAPDAEVEVVLTSDLGVGVVEAAEKFGATLIVLGTHGRGGIKRLILGSVAEHVVRTASCPVMTVRGGE